METTVKYNFEGQVALVTGAGSGMGLTAANLYAESGAAVVLSDRNEAAVKLAAQQLIDKGYKAIAIACDVTNEADVKAMIDKTVATFGRLDIAFNNAGVISKHSDTVNLPDSEWDRVISINLRGVWNCMKFEIPEMLKHDSGVIVNNASVGGINGFAGLPAYTASKHGVVGLTKTAALEYATKGIRINAVCPGMIDTPMNDGLVGGDEKLQAKMLESAPIGRLGKPEEIANAVLWLSSPDASFVIGHALPVDGGFSAK